MAAPQARSGLATGAARVLGWFIGDTSVYVGNQATADASVLTDISRVSQRVANVQMTVS